jgi:hypothetical protein
MKMAGTTVERAAHQDVEDHFQTMVELLPQRFLICQRGRGSGGRALPSLGKNGGSGVALVC